MYLDISRNKNYNTKNSNNSYVNISGIRNNQ